jgi:dihydropyrimidinase
VCNTTTADDFHTGSRAALRGGTTTVIDFACPNKGESLRHGLELWHEKADGKTYCDYGFHMTIDDWNPAIEAELPEMFAAGISSFKMYLTYPAMMIGDENVYLALKKIRALGGIAGVHCENAGIIDGMIAERKAAGELSPASHPLTRPPYAEAEAVSPPAAHRAGGGHAGCGGSPDQRRRTAGGGARPSARAKGLCGDLPAIPAAGRKRLFPGGLFRRRTVCLCPAAAEQERTGGSVARPAPWRNPDDFHRPLLFHAVSKGWAGKYDFTKIPGGLPGVETRGELIFSFGVAKRNISLATMCRALSENPARLYGLFPRKGILRKGSDADIVVYDPTASHVIRADDCVANVDYNPYEGFVTNGSISRVYLRGKLSVKGGKVLAEPCGKYMARGKSNL